ncbi:MAG: ABC transporter substrate-binding protein [Candidatus Riflebacteria bacterium]|nr:ABC transporter substrate-binding protein [Candidatus Riflebacteria bacterium]
MAVPADLTLPAPGSFSRIVSLAPSLTETLFALGLGNQVVGVTDFCSFPPEVKTKTRIGGFIDPNIELILGLRPDLVVMLPDHREMRTRLEGMGLRCLAVPQYTVHDILASLIIVGTACGVRDHARDVRRAIAHDLHLVRQRIKDRPPVRAVLSVGRDLTGGRLDQACLAGPKGYLSDLLARAGGTNAVTESVLTYPSVSREGLAALAPEVVIDLIPDPDRQGKSLETIRRAWQEVPGLPAARTGRIHILDTDFAAIPGPRVAEVVRTFARLLHPEPE